MEDFGTVIAGQQPPQEPERTPYIRILQPKGEMHCVMRSGVKQACGVFLHFQTRGSLCVAQWDGEENCEGCKQQIRKFWYAAIVGRDSLDGSRAVMMVPNASWHVWSKGRAREESLVGLELLLMRASKTNPSSPCRLSVMNSWKEVPKGFRALDNEQAVEVIRKAYARFQLQA